MCGIVGFNWSDDKLIRKISEEISYRGPDDSGHFVDEKVSLGFRRLSIQDLSPKGAQPMIRSQYSIVFNGEIYNFKEIRDELSDYDFTTGTDTEVILYAYDKWGLKCLEKFNGMFAFCLYDKKNSSCLWLVIGLEKNHFIILTRMASLHSALS